MKKIGVITILNVNNYGAELQAFALIKKLNDLGYDAEIINYLFYKNPKFIKTKKSKPIVRLGIKKAFKELFYPIINKVLSARNIKKRNNREIKFLRFHKRFTKLSKTYNSINSLYDDQSMDYDVYIAGSDQIWNPFTYTNLEPYFLMFAPKNVKKISYASSFGVDEIPTKYENIYKRMLSNLDNISVREDTGTTIVEKITGEKINWVLDPTLLLTKNEWLDYSKKPDISEPYLLLYVLNDSKYIQNLSDKISKKLGLKIIRICKEAVSEDKRDHILNITDAGPQEFLGWFLNADYILTTSFHGTCFSINFNIPFKSIFYINKKNNSRQLSILKEFDLTDQILFEGDSLSTESLKKINFESVNKRLNLKRHDSVNFLTKSIDS